MRKHPRQRQMRWSCALRDARAGMQEPKLAPSGPWPDVILQGIAADTFAGKSGNAQGGGGCRFVI